MTYQIQGARVERVYIEREPDYDCDLSHLEDPSNYAGLPDEEVAKYLAQDRERLEAYHRGEWSCVGVVAVAEVVVPTSAGGWIDRTRITSPGLWGIETDSGEDYFEEVGNEERAQLLEILRDGYRFPADELAEHFSAETTA